MKSCHKEVGEISSTLFQTTSNVTKNGHLVMNNHANAELYNQQLLPLNNETSYTLNSNLAKASENPISIQFRPQILLLLDFMTIQQLI